MKKVGILFVILTLVGSLAVIAAQFSIYDWWTAGGEKQAITAELNYFHQLYPEIKITQNPVAGGAGVNMHAVIKSLIFAGLPPTTFQVHAGWEMYEYTSAKLLDSITDLWQSEGWTKVFPKRIQELCSYDGKFYAVPMDIHRANMLWYNMSIFKKLGLKVPTTFQGLMNIMKQIKAAGYTPLAVGDRYQWPAAMVFEEGLLAIAGPKTYDDFFQGKVNYSNSKVQEALKDFRYIMENYVNENHASLTWDQACGLVANGKAAMTIMGDWANGYFMGLGLKAGVDYGAVAVPGSQGVYNLVIDAFPVPKGLSTVQKKYAYDWLKTIASVKGQAIFNQIKGSIPARIDVPTTGFNTVQVTNMKELKTDVLVASAVHGSEAPAPFVTAWENALTVVQYHPTMSIEQAVKYLNAINAQYLTPQKLVH